MDLIDPNVSAGESLKLPLRTANVCWRCNELEPRCHLVFVLLSISIVPWVGRLLTSCCKLRFQLSTKSEFGSFRTFRHISVFHSTVCHSEDDIKHNCATNVSF